MLRQQASDERVHKRLVSTNLAFKDLVSWHHVPVLEDEKMVLKPWPLILPTAMACCPVSCLATILAKLIVGCPFLISIICT